MRKRKVCNSSPTGKVQYAIAELDYIRIFTYIDPLEMRKGKPFKSYIFNLSLRNIYAHNITQINQHILPRCIYIYL